MQIRICKSEDLPKISLVEFGCCWIAQTGKRSIVHIDEYSNTQTHIEAGAYLWIWVKGDVQDDVCHTGVMVFGACLSRAPDQDDVRPPAIKAGPDRREGAARLGLGRRGQSAKAQLSDIAGPADTGSSRELHGFWWDLEQSGM